MLLKSDSVLLLGLDDLWDRCLGVSQVNGGVSVYISTLDL